MRGEGGWWYAGGVRGIVIRKEIGKDKETGGDRRTTQGKAKAMHELK